LAVYLRRWSQGTIIVKFLEFCKYGEKGKKAFGDDSVVVVRVSLRVAVRIMNP
jgi:hypothetical protein